LPPCHGGDALQGIAALAETGTSDQYAEKEINTPFGIIL